MHGGTAETGQQVQQCDMSADELEQWTFWQGPEVVYHQTLDKERITSSLLFGDGMWETGPSCQVTQAVANPKKNYLVSGGLGSW